MNNHSKFEFPSDGNLVTKGAFDQTWTVEYSLKKKGDLLERWSKYVVPIRSIAYKLGYFLHSNNIRV